MQERIKIVLLVRIPGLLQKAEIVELRKRPVVGRRRRLGKELVGKSQPPSDNDDPAVRQDLVRGVPPPLPELPAQLRPVGAEVVARPELTDPTNAVSVTAGLDENSVSVDGAGGAPRVGADSERTEGVGDDVVEKGVSGAVGSVGFGRANAFAAGEGEIGGTHVGPVEDYDLVVFEELHVHGRDSDARMEKIPVAA